MSRTWMVPSAGCALPVAGPDVLAAWWPRLAPQIPGTPDGPLEKTAAVPVLVLPAGGTPTDARRRINAHLHADHLRHSTLSVHGVAVVKDSKAALLLGGHGAGKTLTALAMITALGWRPAGGDTCLIQDSQRGARLIGGTLSWVVRRSEARRWLPDLQLTDQGSELVEVAGQLGIGRGQSERASVLLAAVAVVRAEGGIGDGGPGWEPCPAQVARSAVYRASGHLIGKVPDDPGADPLCLAETAVLARNRLALARHCAESTAWHLLRGSPREMAVRIDYLVRRGGGRW